MKQINSEKMTEINGGGANCSLVAAGSVQEWVKQCFASCDSDVLAAVLNGSFAGIPGSLLTVCN